MNRQQALECRRALDDWIPPDGIEHDTILRKFPDGSYLVRLMMTCDWNDCVEFRDFHDLPTVKEMVGVDVLAEIVADDCGDDPFWCDVPLDSSPYELILATAGRG